MPVRFTFAIMVSYGVEKQCDWFKCANQWRFVSDVRPQSGRWSAFKADHPSARFLGRNSSVAFKAHTKFWIASLTFSIFSYCAAGSVSSVFTRSEGAVPTPLRASLRSLSLGKFVMLG